ncbi:ABC transporter permease [Actinotalea sp.]|uniref:ABC transporter permease n=1 Tax=Actinotalea sp. TaxID=1872145 RepID=UPI00356334B9
MFVAWRDLRFARGRFVLIGSVVALITLLVGFLAGLTGGLAAQNVSAVLALPADRIVFSPGPEASFSDSTVTAEQIATWAGAAGVDEAWPLGLTQVRAEHGAAGAAVAVLGAPAGLDLLTPGADGTMSLSDDAAQELGAVVGDTVTLVGSPYTVTAVGGEGWYAHTPVVQVTLADWQRMSTAMGSPGQVATVIAVTGSPDWALVDRSAGTLAEPRLTALLAVEAFRSEIGSLLLMVALLFGISALVVGAFFTVWTMQRAGDVAVLKALGASTRSLVTDALGQSLVVLLAGVGTGTAVAIGSGLLAGTALPFLFHPLTTVAPAVLMIVVGLAGAAFALRSVTVADPLTALGSHR